MQLYRKWNEEIRRVATTSDDGTTLVWKFHETEFQCEAVLKTESDDTPPIGITSCAFAPHRYVVESKGAKTTAGILATGSKDKSIKIWTLEDGHQTHISLATRSETDPNHHHHQGHEDFVTGVCWNPRAETRGKYQLVSYGDDKKAIAWDTTSGRCVSKLRNDGVGHHGVVSMATFSRDGMYVLTSSVDKTCMLWEAGREDPLVRVYAARKNPEAAHTDAVWSARLNSSATKFVSAGADARAILWSTVTGQYETCFNEHTDGIVDAKWSKDESKDKTLFLTSSFDGTAKLWDIRQQASVRTFDDHKFCVWSAEFGKDSNTILTASHDMMAYVYDMRFNIPRYVLAGHTGMIWKAAITLDGTWAVTCSEDMTARVWNISKGERHPPCHILQTPERRHRSTVTCADFQEFHLGDSTVHI